MALTFVEQPNSALLYPSQNHCGTLTYKLTSDIYISDYGEDAEYVLSVTGLPTNGQYIEMEGVRLTFVTGGGSLAPGEVAIPGTAAEVATIIADYFDTALDEISAVATTGPDIVTFTKSAFWLIGDINNGIKLVFENLSNASFTSINKGYPLIPLRNYSILYDIRLNNEYPPLFKGQIKPKIVRDPDTETYSATLSLDVSELIKNYEGLNASHIDDQINSAATLQIKFAERVGSVGGLWQSANELKIIHASCNCNKYDFQDYAPGTLEKKFLFIEGDDDARKLCPNDKLVLYGLVDAGSYALEIDSSVPGGFTTIVAADRVGIRVDASAYIAGISGIFEVGLGGTDNSNEIGPLEFSRNNKSNAECCNLSQILFLNCLGGWQYMGITTLRSAGIQISATEYVSCSVGTSKTRTAAKTSSLTETYYTRPLRVTEANIELLNQFLNSGAYIDLDGNPIQLIVEEYAIETPNRRIQIAFTVKNLENDYALIDSVYNQL